MPNDQIIPDYNKWGNGDGKKPLIESASSFEAECALNIIKNLFDLTDLKLVLCLKVESYRGKVIPPITLILMRFAKKASSNYVQLSEEHLTILVDINNNKLHGFTKLFHNPSITDYLISHELALNSAISFIQLTDHGLTPRGTTAQLPTLDKLDSYSKLHLHHKLTLGPIEVYWINKHYENVFVEKSIKKIWGMKVKMYNSITNLWSWVIVDAEGKILTFEKDIFWNLKTCIRDTQMWLHDDWLRTACPDLL